MALSSPPSYEDSLAGKMAAPSASAPAVVMQQLDSKDSRFKQYVKQQELLPVVADKLYTVLSKADVVLCCDDSDSMAQAIAEEGTDPFALKKSTRWLELKKLAAEIIACVTAINEEKGLDIYFLNRPPLHNVTTPAGLQAAFAVPPTGATPLCACIEAIVARQAPISQASGRQLLLVVITDGEPAGSPKETRDNLKAVLIRATASGIVHVSFAECTDQADDMEYLDQWDGQIRNFDNTDDYREELSRVRNIQGPQFKFTFQDYCAKILLATFDRYYFNLDQVKVSALPGATVAAPASIMSTSSQYQWSPPTTSGGGGSGSVYTYVPPQVSSSQAMPPQQAGCSCVVL